MLTEKRFIFKRTILDLPLVIFLSSQFLSTIISIDSRTSLFGYYSRFHGGLFSTVCYSLLFWGLVSNIDKNKAFKLLKISLFSGLLVSSYAILQRLGIDKNIWVQDVQNRVFSTLGQPNWLAAWIVAIIPLTWSFGIVNFKVSESKQSKIPKIQILKFFLWLAVSSIFFVTLLFTKSRSGILGFVVSVTIFWPVIGILWFKEKLKIINFITVLLIFSTSFLILIVLVGTPWTPKLSQVGRLAQQSEIESDEQTITSPALEVGGTESATIRKIVWQGAINIWKAYPITGSGVETFAYSYYQFRPAEHNLVSEWDYLYNKAHNEYLNIAATTGTIGLLSYSVLIIFAAIVFIKNAIFPHHTLKPSKQKRENNSFLLEEKVVNIALASGWTSILVTNFFGFSVVPVALQFFLYPALAIALKENKKEIRLDNSKLSKVQIVGIILITLFIFALIYSILRYWYADFLFSKGELENKTGNYVQAREILEKTLSISSKEALYWNELSDVDSSIAVAVDNQENGLALKFANLANSESLKAISLSPSNVNLKRDRARILISLSAIVPEYLISARETLEQAVKIAPTEAKLYHNLGLAYLRTGDMQKAVITFEKAVELKPDYRDARFALGLTYVDLNRLDDAKRQYEYILENIKPDDTQVMRELEEL